ncbi:NAD nucleotidase [Thiolinea disciformis]|uniref:NAD nucleotidase n=1 Tax=Thiolinea disciformis TaxID=125614 RepID=UPI00036C364E|nr:NAD nucleotidase [Thiolinea disciformis]
MKLTTFSSTLLLSAALGLVLSACNDKDNNGTESNLRILHINDHHSNLAPASAELSLGGAATTVELGGFSKVVTKIRELAGQDPNNTLKLHAGDAITGTLYYTLFKGEADAALMNQVCFDAFELGNHEFDEGDKGLKTFLDYLKSASTCNTPVLAANVVPKVGESPLAPNTSTDYFKPYIIKELNGKKYGIIGIDVAGKTKNSSNPDKNTLFLNEAQTAQKYIDELENKGISKIILLTHQGYTNDLSLAKSLSGVDVIIGGDSHSLLGGTALTSVGLKPEGEYPTKTTDKAGKTVCVAQAWQYASTVGELTINFDSAGNVKSCSGKPHVLLGNTFKRNGTALAGADLQTVLNAVEANESLSVVTPDQTSDTILKTYSDKVTELKKTQIGTAAQNLCFTRIPGDVGRSKLAGCDALTKAHGSDISNIVAKAFLMMSNTSDISIQNAGGVRTDVAMGTITIDTAYTMLPFANTLTEIEMTGQQILDVLEEATEFALQPSGSTGSYPYASGLRWDMNLSKPFGQRLSNVQVNSRVAGTWAAIDKTKTYKVVTNSFTAGGKDGYLTFGDIPASKKTDTFLDYAKSFVDYVQKETAAGRVIDKLPIEEYSTQQFINAKGEMH